MGIKDRLREERLRLGLSQTEIATAVGSSNRAQIYYEKGERRPDADYLAAFALAGADVLYILTGHRMGALGAGMSDRDAEAKLDQIEAACLAAGDALPSDSAAHRGALQSIALDISLPDRIRARSDTMLRLVFHDDAADQRHIARETRVLALQRRARMFVDDAARAAGYVPTPRIQSGLERLIATAPDAPDDVIKWVVADLIAALLAEG